MEIKETGKITKFLVDNGFTYQESLLDENGDILEFLMFVKESDYSIYYCNGTGVRKVGRFNIKEDSIFFPPFNNLVFEEGQFIIEDDYSDRYVKMEYADKGIGIEVHLLKDELDGSIELKNIMTDFRSNADVTGKNTKAKLNTFFDEMLAISQKYEENKPKTLVKTNSDRKEI